MKKTGIIINCKQCNKEVYMPAWRRKKGKNKFCSYDCYWKSKKGIIINSEIVQCTTCDKEMTQYQYQKKKGKGKTCSWKCAKKSISKTLTGRTQSEETKEKRAKKLRGRIYPDEVYDGRRGKNNYRWKGGDKRIYRRLRNTKKYRMWRKAVFKRDDYTCKSCGSKSGYDGTVYLEPHHIIWVRELIKYNLIKHVFNIDNGITLCRPCHLQTMKTKK